ncbi:hypothetical protein K474DRAFT_1663413 [Panus rudis PR-1116 ss-1]|nr:hypothetical protein K474DRAFT_1663413 [Panus rudis PR-1116 ss-1]
MSTHNVTIQDSSPLIVYRGDWVESQSTSGANATGTEDASGGSYHTTSASGSFQLANFYASAVYVYGTSSSNSGSGGIISASLLSIFNPLSLYSTTQNAQISLVDSFSSIISSSGNNNSTSATNGKSPGEVTLLYQKTNLNASQPHTLIVSTGGGGGVNLTLDYIILENPIISDTGALHNITLDSHLSSVFETIGSVPTSQGPPVGGNSNVTAELEQVGDRGVFRFCPSAYPFCTFSARVNFRGSGIQLYGTMLNASFVAQMTWYTGSQVDSEVYISTGSGINASSYDTTPSSWPSSSSSLSSSPPSPSSTMGNSSSQLLFTRDGLPEGQYTLSLEQIRGIVFKLDYAVILSTDANNTNGLQLPTANGLSTTNFNAHFLPTATVNGIIIGCVLGGTILIALVSSICVVRRRRKREHVRLIDLGDDNRSIAPSVHEHTDSDVSQTAQTSSSTIAPFLLHYFRPPTSSSRSNSHDSGSESRTPSPQPQPRSRRQSSESATLAPPPPAHTPPPGPPPPDSRRRAVDGGRAVARMSVDAQSIVSTASTLPPTYDPAWLSQGMPTEGSRRPSVRRR